MQRWRTTSGYVSAPLEAAGGRGDGDKRWSWRSSAKAVDATIDLLAGQAAAWMLD